MQEVRKERRQQRHPKRSRGVAGEFCARWTDTNWSANMANPYVFIVGCPRSGTTLLQRMVDAHPQTAITPESRTQAERLEPTSRNP